MPTDEEIHTAFEQGEAAVMAVFYAVATQVAALAQQLAKQDAVLQALQARLAKSSHNSSKPPSSDGYSKVKRTASLRKAGDKPNGGQPGHEGQTLLAVEHPERTVTYVVPICAHCHASLQGIEAMGYEEQTWPRHTCHPWGLKTTGFGREIVAPPDRKPLIFQLCNNFGTSKYALKTRQA